MNINIRSQRVVLILFLISIGSFGFSESLKSQDVFVSYEIKEFTFKGHEAKIVFPKIKNENNYWIWRARFWGHEPQVDLALLEEGFHVAYIDVAGLYGNDEAVELWNLFYDFCISEYGLNPKVVLEGMSRGGLIVYNWASVNTDKVACIYADAPVCDIKSWPGGWYNGQGSVKDWIKCLEAYQLDSISVRDFKGIPVNTSVNVAKAGVPVLHLYGDADKVVPFKENTAALASNFQQAGGSIKLICKEGIGHHPHCLENPKPIVDFILSNLESNSGYENILSYKAMDKEHPFLLATNTIFDEVKDKVEQHQWAKDNYTSMLSELDTYQFPKQKIVTKPRPTKVWSSLNYGPADGEKAFKLALAYKLSGNDKYLTKLLDFVRKLTDREEGYLSVGAATYGVMVHEGNFFLHLAAACDVVYDELTRDDRQNIEGIFRRYLKQNREHMVSNGIMNHQASANAGAILVALYLEDMDEINHLTYADGGMADQIGKGVMADGWWFESTVNYCYLVAQRYCLVAQAYQNYGWDLYHKHFPAKYKDKDFENCKDGFTGMKFENWGPTGKSTRGLEDMVSPYVPFMDENAVVVSSNDSKATAPDPYYELAYRQYGNEEFAWVLDKTKRDSWVSLMYGVPELPNVADPRTESAFAANVGITALRSQKEGESSEEQIQAYFKFGTHGGWHGQFDRTGMLALDRYGHKYFGTEMCWYGYGHPGYKECVQTSATHNMVVIDELQQEAVPSDQLLFHKGEMMQACVTQTVARWRPIPRFNIDKFPPWNDFDFAPDFEPVLQRRLSIVTDDYVVIADFVQSSQQHDYYCLIHPVGLKTIDGAKETGAMQDKLNKDANSPYSYFENAQWYNMKKGAQAHFDDNGFKLDVHTVWPKKAKMFIANYPDGGRRQGIRNNPDRRTLGIRVSAKEAVFFNVVEPFKGESAISKITSGSHEELIVSLKDGREQIIKIAGFKGDGNEIEIAITESRSGNIITTEKTK